MFVLQGMVQKSNPMQQALDELRSFLDPNEPQIARVLYNTWQSQGNAITYKSLREALIYAVETDSVNGLMLWHTLYQDWQHDYNLFVKKTLAPMWDRAFEEANRRAEIELNRRVQIANNTLGGESVAPWKWDGAMAGVKEWSETKGAAFVTNSTETQIMAVREVVKRAATSGVYNVDTLAQAIRPMVGLTMRDSVAATKYLEALGKQGVKPSVAVDRVHRYAQKKHKLRAEVIARTELAFSYNHGEYLGALQAYNEGYIGRFEKVWSTAADELVCEICGSLNGTVVGMYDDFDGIQTNLTDPEAKKCPPAHPRCRCGFIIREIEPPNIPKLSDVLNEHIVIR